MKFTKNYLSKAACLVLSVSVFLFASCRKEKSYELPVNSDNTIQIEVHDSPEPGTSTLEPRWYKEDGVVCVVFAYGFNSKSFYDTTVKRLAKEYGLDSDGGIIHPMLYPDDFKGKISNLRSAVNELNLRGLLIIGAPEGTHYALAALKQDWEEQVPYPVFSFFPQDNILGQEASCDFVLELERTAEEEASATEISIDMNHDVEGLIVRGIKYMTELTQPLASDTNLHQHVQNIVGSRKVLRYIDRESGIQSINHFVMESK